MGGRWVLMEFMVESGFWFSKCRKFRIRYHNQPVFFYVHFYIAVLPATPDWKVRLFAAPSRCFSNGNWRILVNCRYFAKIVRYFAKSVRCFAMTFRHFSTDLRARKTFAKWRKPFAKWRKSFAKWRKSFARRREPFARWRDATARLKWPQKGTISTFQK